ncbi:MAG: hypothetical protein H6586_08835 [Flavobacteriales bacterium]|nr:hypothetical protein [Flavobacteriales bacterium]
MDNLTTSTSSDRTSKSEEYDVCSFHSDSLLLRSTQETLEIGSRSLTSEKLSNLPLFEKTNEKIKKLSIGNINEKITITSCISQGMVNELILLLRNSPIECSKINASGAFGRPHIINAIVKGNFEIIITLLLHGGKLLQSFEKNGANKNLLDFVIPESLDSESYIKNLHLVTHLREQYCRKYLKYNAIFSDMLTKNIKEIKFILGELLYQDILNKASPPPHYANLTFDDPSQPFESLMSLYFQGAQYNTYPICISQRIASGWPDRFSTSSLLGEFNQILSNTLQTSINSPQIHLWIGTNFLIHTLAQDRFSNNDAYNYLELINSIYKCISNLGSANSGRLKDMLIECYHISKLKNNLYQNLLDFDTIKDKLNQTPEILSEFDKDLPSDILAREIRSWTIHFYADLDTNQFLNFNLSSSDKNKDCLHIQNYANESTALILHIQSKILNEPHAKARAEKIDFWIEVAATLLKFNDNLGPDLAGAKFIHAALQGPVGRLKKSFGLIHGQETLNKLNELYNGSKESKVLTKNILKKGAIPPITGYQTDKEMSGQASGFERINGYGVANNTAYLYKQVCSCYRIPLTTNLKSFLKNYFINESPEIITERLNLLSAAAEPAKYLPLTNIQSLQCLITELENRKNSGCDIIIKIHNPKKSRYDEHKNAEAVTFLEAWVETKRVEINSEKLDLFKAISALNQEKSEEQQSRKPDVIDEALKNKNERYLWLSDKKNQQFTFVGNTDQNDKLESLFEYFRKYRNPILFSIKKTGSQIKDKSEPIIKNKTTFKN